MTIAERIKKLEAMEKNYEVQLIAVRGALQELRSIVAEEDAEPEPPPEVDDVS